ncbi:MAG: fumarate/nitrate reduction transcriptional regulator Fnr [Pseudomonadales bacterium]|nr:fumarate/nitrate reduction transcriptional regulator Fnr [Pseudomonadales bacterium]
MSDSHKYVVSCQACSLNALCVPHSLTEEEIELVDATVKRSKPVQRNKTVFESGDAFSSLYAVRSGAIKTYSVDEDGEEHVIGFYLPGEMFGMDAISRNVHISSAKALETTAICEIPYNRLEELSAKVHNLQSHMYRLLSREIADDQDLQLMLSKKTAEERIGNFLLNLSHRYQMRRLSPTTFRLPMARTDIGNYLGLAVETVSRIFTRLQKNQILKVDGKEVEILDHNRLCEIANACHEHKH